MLIPAIIYKEQIQNAMRFMYYTDDMFNLVADVYDWTVDICDDPQTGLYQWAICDGENLAGYMSYMIDYYNDKAYNFCIVSFNKNNPIIGFDLFNKMRELIAQHHVIEWRMVSGNPVEKHYDNFAKRYNGNKYILKDRYKDRKGAYHDDVIYEIFGGNK